MDWSSRIQAAVPVFIPPGQNSRIPVDSLGTKSRGEFFLKKIHIIQENTIMQLFKGDLRSIRPN